MKIYRVWNIKHNYCKGYFYFGAKNIEEAKRVIDEYQNKHNTKVEHINNYGVKFDTNEIQMFELKLGFLPLNRGTVEGG